jgi:GAF domain-containing protein
MDDIDGARRRLGVAVGIAEVARIVRVAARSVTGAQGATFVLRENDKCFYVDEDAIAPLWKGQRFPLTECISGWAMINNETAVVSDIETDPRIPLAAYRSTFVRSLAMVPVGSPEPIAAIGAYWSVARQPSEAAVNSLRELAALTSVAIARVGLADAPWAPNFADTAPRAK